MKRRIISLVIAAILLVCSLTACSNGGANVNSTKTTTTNISNFKYIDGEDNLCYDRDSKVVYYLFSTWEIGNYGYGYMSPYISENGYFCKYVDDKIVEIVNNTN